MFSPRGEMIMPYTYLYFKSLSLSYSIIYLLKVFPTRGDDHANEASHDKVFRG